MSEAIFRESGFGPGLRWLGLCGVMAIVVMTGWAFNRLTACCVGLILVFTFIRAVWPYCSLVQNLGKDIALCREERTALINTDARDADALLDIDTGNAGTVFKLSRQLVAARRHGTRGTTRSFFAAFDAFWEERISPIQDAADQAPVLGLAGSLIGIAQAIQALGNGQGNSALFDSLSAMALTTLVGGAAYIVISGLARDAENRVRTHRSNLEHVAGIFHPGDESGDQPVPESFNPFEFGRSNDG